MREPGAGGNGTGTDIDPPMLPCILGDGAVPLCYYRAWGIHRCTTASDHVIHQNAGTHPLVTDGRCMRASVLHAAVACLRLESGEPVVVWAGIPYPLLTHCVCIRACRICRVVHTHIDLANRGDGVHA